jgi:CubicO group peptidase (beta-lactamase class C family)
MNFLKEIGRRKFLAFGAQGLTLPFWSKLAPAMSSMDDTTLTLQNTVAWHGRNTAEHKSLVDKWAALNFRTISLAIYGDPADPLYAAVMVKRAAFHAESQVFPRTQDALQQDFNTNANKGWGPYIITAVGPQNSPTFAACFRPMNAIPFTRLNLSHDEFSSHNADRHALGEILICFDCFGDGSNLRFTGIWGPNPDKQAWTIDGYNVAAGSQEFVLDATAQQQRFEAIASTWGRPGHIAVTPLGESVELFVDSSIGAWVSRLGLTSDQYQAEFNKQTTAGLMPLRVSAKGSGSNARFSVIFASREEIDPRTFRSQGPVTIPAIDNVIKDFMQSENLRGTALAIARGTQLVYAKGYTLAEPGYPDITPQTLFRQASVSKTYTGVAMMRLLQLKAKGVTLDTPIQSILNLQQPNGSAPSDSRWATITIKHLMESDSGIPQGLIYGSFAASQAFGTPLPATFAQLLSYATSQMLTGAPGDKNNSVYGNFDYILLGQIIAKLQGTHSYEQALDQLVLLPLHQTHTRGSRSLIKDQLQGEVRHHMTVYEPKGGWKLFPFEVLEDVRSSDAKLMPTHYGNLDYEMFSSAGGLSASVVDIARLGAMFSDFDANPVLTVDSIDMMMKGCANAGATLTAPDGKASHGYYGLDWVSISDANNHVYTGAKGGWLPGQGTVVQFTTGGFTYAIATNGNGDVKYDWMTPIANITQNYSWAAGDLFANSFGMSSLTPVRKLVPIPSNKVPITETQTHVKESMARGSDLLVRQQRVIRPLR